MVDLNYEVKPVGELREEISSAAAKWPLAESTVFEEANPGAVRCEWITAPGRDGTVPANDSAVYLHAHGGGYYRGSSRVDAAICSYLGAMAGVRCLSVNYRRPPDEGVFPAAVDDMFSVWQWLTSDHGGRVPPARVIVGGTSAGGGLCLALLLKIRDEGSQMPGGAIAVSPWTDMTQSGESFETNAAHGPAKAYLDHWSGVYLDGVDPTHPYASPLFGELDELPPLLIQVGGHETMLDDASAFATKAARAGCTVSLEVYAGQPHSFQHDVGTEDIAREAVERMAGFVGRWTEA